LSGLRSIGSGAIAWPPTLSSPRFTRRPSTRFQSCRHHRAAQGPARGDFRLGCLVERTPVTASGPGCGEDYDAGRIELRLYYCPGCGRQLETQVALRTGHPPSGFRLLGAGDLSAR